MEEKLARARKDLKDLDAQRGEVSTSAHVELDVLYEFVKQLVASAVNTGEESGKEEFKEKWSSFVHAKGGTMPREPAAGVGVAGNVPESMQTEVWHEASAVSQEGSQDLDSWLEGDSLAFV